VELKIISSPFLGPQTLDVKTVPLSWTNTTLQTLPL
jgi:hypothetical protein